MEEGLWPAAEEEWRQSAKQTCKELHPTINPRSKLRCKSFLVEPGDDCNLMRDPEGTRGPR